MIYIMMATVSSCSSSGRRSEGGWEGEENATEGRGDGRSSADMHGSERNKVEALGEGSGSPVPSDLARDRKTLCNPPVGKRRRTTVVITKSEPKSVSPQERVREFKDEALIVSCGKLFCSAWREQVSLRV